MGNFIEDDFNSNFKTCSLETKAKLKNLLCETIVKEDAVEPGLSADDKGRADAESERRRKREVRHIHANREQDSKFLENFLRSKRIQKRSFIRFERKVAANEGRKFHEKKSL